jgi:hypothetical protein
MRKEAVVASFNLHPGISLEEMSKTGKNLEAAGLWAEI